MIKNLGFMIYTGESNHNTMKKGNLAKIINYNEHAIFMSEIALSILNNDKNILNIKGVIELIAMYLLIHYITNTHLDKPNKNYYNIPKLDTNSLFTRVYAIDGTLMNMTLDGLRNAICHSFVTIEENRGIVLDDRASCDRKTHNELDNKGYCNRLVIEKTRQKLLELHKQVINSQKEHNNNLIATIEVEDEQS